MRLIENDRATAEFDHITRRLVEMDGLSVSRQRLDSTHVISDMAVLTRLGLFAETVTNFLKDLKREEAGKLESLGKVLFKRYLDREGAFTGSGVRWHELREWGEHRDVCRDGRGPANPRA